VTTEQDRRGALEAVDRILNRGGDADDVLRQVLAVLRRLYPFAAISFVERGKLVAGPFVGERTAPTEARSITFNGLEVARLDVAASTAEDRAFLDRVALLISPYCLVGWDTAGEGWNP
jgi:putative methionine-R-sulfoxide reductase with GAF domain